MADADVLQALTAALQACWGDASPTSDPTAARGALRAADVAAQALLRLAADPAQHAAALDSAVSAVTSWLKVLEGRLDRWEAALGPQPVGPEKAALDGPIRAVEYMATPPPAPTAVLTYWAPSPGKVPGREHQAAWDACISLIEHLWCPYEAPRVVSGELLSRAARRYGSTLGRYIALSPVLAYHATLCDRAQQLRSAAPADLAAWAAAMHRVLSLLTGPLESRVKGVVMGSCVGGPASSFDSLGRCELLTRSAAVLRLLPSLAAAAAGIPANSTAEAGGGSTAAVPEAGQELVLDTEQWVLEVGQMLVQLLAGCCSSFNPDVREKAGKGDFWWDTSLPHIRRAYVTLGLELLPSLVAPPLAVLSASGPAFAEAARWRLYGCSGSWATVEAREAAVHKWGEWQMALHDLCGLAWSLGEEVAAGPAGSPYGNCRTGADRISTHVPFPTTDAAAVAAEEAVQASGAWPPRDPATLAAAAAAAQHLLGRWHTIRAALLPPPPADPDASVNDKSLAHMSRIALRLQQRVPHTCRQLVAAAAATLRCSSAAQLQAALMPLLDAASTACKLVMLACSDAAHRALLGISEAAPANDAPDICPPCRPYRPIDLMLTTCQAAASCVRRLLAQPSPLPPEHQEFARRRTRALLLQLCAAAQAAAQAGEPLALQIAAAWGGGCSSSSLPRAMGVLLETCGSMRSAAQVALSRSLLEGLADARALAGSEVQQQLALDTLPCASVSCTAAGAGGSEAALPGKRCGGCSTHRYSSTLCQQAAWRAGHRQCCRSLAAEAAAAPPAVPPPYGGEVPRKRERALLCPLCGMGLALAAAAEGASSEEHVASCRRHRDGQLAAQRAQHGGDAVAAAAALPEAAWLRQSRREREEERARLAVPTVPIPIKPAACSAAYSPGGPAMAIMVSCRAPLPSPGVNRHLLAVKPSAPSIESIGVLGPNAQLYVDIKPPTAPGDSAITSYQVTGQPNGGATPSTPAITTAGLGDPVPGSQMRRLVFAKYTAAKAYRFTVTARNTAGWSAASAAVSFTTPAASVPGVCSIANITMDNGIIEITVNPPAKPGTSAVTNYQVAGNPKGGSSTGMPRIVVTGLGEAVPGTKQRLLRISQYQKGIQYYFTASASNKAGFGAESIPRIPYLPPSVKPGKPTITAVAIVVDAKGVNTLTVDVRPPAAAGDSAISEYTVVGFPSGGISRAAKPLLMITSMGEAITGGNRRFRFSTYGYGVVYNFNATAFNQAGPGPASAVVQFATPNGALPGPPSQVTVGTGAGGIVVQVTPPVGSTGAGLTYNITGYPDNASVPVLRATGAGQAVAGTTKRQFVIATYRLNQVYRFSVQAVSSGGAGAEKTPRVVFYNCAQYFKDTSTGCQCGVAATGCKEKAADGCSCKTCTNGYKADGKGGCSLCPAISRCTTYSTVNCACTQCSQSYFTGAACTCAVDGTNCAVKNADNCTCKTCKSGYMTSQDGGCTKCTTIAKCKTYSGTNCACTGCDQFFNVAGNGASCQCSLTGANCKTKNADQCSCQTCAATYGSDNKGGCAKCPTIASCTAYSPADCSCTACAPYFTVAGNGASCQCSLTGANCKTKNADQCSCQTCDATYGSDNKGGCAKCPTIASCTAYSPTNCSCTTCAPYFAVAGNGASCQCSLPGTGCKTKSADQCSCQTCETGYVSDKKGGCAQCAVENCATYDANTCTCTACAANFKLVDGACTACGDTEVTNCATYTAADKCLCESCAEDYYLSGDSKACSLCPDCAVENCATYDANTCTCTACAANFKLVDGACTACGDTEVTNCATYTAADKCLCESCAEDYYLSGDSKACSLCPDCAVENCATYDANTCTCTACAANFKLVDGACTACGDTEVTNCATYTAADKCLCESCAEDYYLSGDSKACSLCPDCAVENCATYDANTCTCTACAANFKLVDGACTACGDTEVTNCATYTAADKCLCESCAEDYYLSGDSKACSLCPDCAVENCATYDANTCTCTACAANFKLVDGACTACGDTEVTNCATYTAADKCLCESCAEDYYLSGDSKACSLCPDCAVENCATYDANTCTCTACAANFKLVDGACTACGDTEVTNCATYTAADKCLCESCAEDYYLSGDSKACSLCPDCAVENCATYDANTCTCTACAANFKLVDGACTACGDTEVTNCATYTAADKCLCESCAEDYYLSGDSKACSLCPDCAVENCATYDANTCTCTACAANFKLVDGACTACGDTEVTNCATYTAADKCLCESCAEDYYLSGDSKACSLCPDCAVENCATYDANTCTCTACAANFKLVDGACTACGDTEVTNCATYTAADKCLCESCAEDYYLSGDSKACSLCPDCAVENCATYDANTCTCTACAANFKLVDGACTACGDTEVTNCATYTAADKCLCESCAEDYYLSGDSKACSLCPDCAVENCATYDANTCTCTACAANFKLVDGACTACGDTEVTNCATYTAADKCLCESCAEDYYLSGDSKACSLCPDCAVENCATYDANTCTCTACAANFKLVDGACTACGDTEVTNCATYTAADKCLCESCAEDYYLSGDSKACSLCPDCAVENCATYDANTCTCTACAANFKLVDGACTACGDTEVTNCATYTAADKCLCESCAEDYYLSGDSKACSLCPDCAVENCATYDANTCTCTACAANFKLVDGACTACGDTEVTNCATYTAADKCLCESCAEDYYLSGDSKACSLCPDCAVENCATYDANTCTCTACAANFKLVDGACTACGDTEVTNCATYTAADKCLCESCAEDYYLSGDSKACSLCPDCAVENCATYDANTCTCTACAANFKLVDGACTACGDTEVTNCATYTAADKCLCESCAEDYYLSGDSKACSLCPDCAVENCATYDANTCTCTACAANFKLVDGACTACGDTEVTNCATYTAADKCLCESCAEDYYLSGDSKACSLCPDCAVENCATYDANTCTCTACAANFKLVDGACTACGDTEVTNCATYTAADKCLCESCAEDYYLSGDSKACSLCPDCAVENCATYDANTCTCTACAANFKLVDGACTACGDTEVTNCATYTAADKCLCESCAEDYYLSGDSKACSLCPDCAVENCATYDANTCTCTACAANFKLVDGACTACGDTEVTNCATYTAADKCLCESCAEDYYLSGDSKACSLCPDCAVENCATYDANTCTCTACAANFKLVDGACTACGDTEVTNCATYTAADKCLCESCAEDYYLSGDSKACSLCPDCAVENCATYDANTCTCTACAANFKLVDGACTACGDTEVTNCATYTAADKCLCESCAEDYYLSGDSKACSLCPDCAVENCATYDANTCTCTACAANFKLVDGACTACGDTEVTNCATYTAADKCLCESCAEDYYLSGDSKACSLCPDCAVENCATYDANTCTCTACAANFKLVDGACTACGDTEVTNCATYTAADKCLCESCAEDYYLSGDSKACSLCPDCAVENCATYDANTCTCTACAANFKLVDGACTACGDTEVTNCATYTAADKCLCESCAEDYYLSGDSKACSLCPDCAVENCATYDANTCTCTACAANFKLVDGACTACGDTEVTNCATYTAADKCLCESCAEDYYLSGDSKACSLCPDCAVENCATYDANTCTCTACAANFKLVDGACTACGDTEVTNCATYTAADKCLCESCAEDYYLSGDSKACSLCPDVANCGTMNTNACNGCDTCAAGYALSQDKKSCTQASGARDCAVENCATYDANTCTCTACAANFKLVDGACTACGDTEVTNCATYTAADKCLCESCAEDYYLSGDSKACSLCPDVANCGTMNTNACNGCDTCAAGYALSQDKKSCTQASGGQR
ncbi:serine threonine, partial [Chlorella sorokiniana]